MQTFLPFPDYERCAQVLDRQRLGKQRVECLQIATALTNANYGWQNHPAVKIWRGHLSGLIHYGLVICDEWTARGYKDSCREKLLSLAAPSLKDEPGWLGSEEVHRSHRSNLLRKDAEHYAPHFEQGLPNDLPYVWPVASVTN